MFKNIGGTPRENEEIKTIKSIFYCAIVLKFSEDINTQIHKITKYSILNVKIYI